MTYRGVARNLLRGGDKTGGLGDGSPPSGVQGQSPGAWGLGRSPQKLETYTECISLLTEKISKKYTTQGKLTQLLTLLL